MAVALASGHGHEAPRLQLEEEQLDCEEHGCDGSGEGRGHAGGSARDEQRLSLGRGEMKELRDHRAERAARHDDRSLGPKGPPEPIETAAEKRR